MKKLFASLFVAVAAVVAAKADVLYWQLAADSISGDYSGNNMRLVATDTTTGDTTYLDYVFDGTTVAGSGTTGINVTTGITLASDLAALGTSSYTGYNFFIEIGTYSSSSYDTPDASAWTRSGISEAIASATSYIDTGSIIPNVAIYTAPSGAITVPEPASGVMLLIGGALLALRRRSRD